MGRQDRLSLALIRSATRLRRCARRLCLQVAAAPPRRFACACVQRLGRSRSCHGVDASNEGSPVHDTELDALLRDSASAPSQVAIAAAVALSREHQATVRSASGRLRRRNSPAWVVSGAAVAVLSLTAAGSVAAYQLGIPPFQTTDPGTTRTVTGIPVNYRNSLDREVDCLAFIEYRNLTPRQEKALDDLTRSSQWRGYGQRLLDRLAIPEATALEQNLAISDAVPDDLLIAAQKAVPGLAFKVKTKGPLFTGSSMSCANPGGADGRP